MLLMDGHSPSPKQNKQYLTSYTAIWSEDQQGHPEITYSLSTIPEISSFSWGTSGLGVTQGLLGLDPEWNP